MTACVTLFSLSLSLSLLSIKLLDDRYHGDPSVTACVTLFSLSLLSIKVLAVQDLLDREALDKVTQTLQDPEGVLGYTLGRDQSHRTMLGYKFGVMIMSFIDGIS